MLSLSHRESNPALIVDYQSLHVQVPGSVCIRVHFYASCFWWLDDLPFSQKDGVQSEDWSVGDESIHGVTSH